MAPALLTAHNRTTGKLGNASVCREKQTSSSFSVRPGLTCTAVNPDWACLHGRVPSSEISLGGSIERCRSRCACCWWRLAEALKALTVTLVLLALQCEWLLGDRKPSPEELDKGIDPDSPLFQAILDNPVVQLGLTNPKTLLGMCAFFTLSHGSGRLAGSLVGRAGAVEATRRIQR